MKTSSSTVTASSNGEQAPSKFTPGPWTVRENDRIQVYGPKCAFVCWTGQRWAAKSIAEKSRANAHLIAAAPDMLEALRETTLQLQYLADKFGETGTGAAVLARVNAAIAKATGVA